MVWWGIGGNVTPIAWTEKDLSAFAIGVERHGKDWKKVALVVETRDHGDCCKKSKSAWWKQKNALNAP